MKKFRIPYSSWKTVVQANGWTIYENIQGEDSSYTYAGNKDFLYNCAIDADDYSDYNINFPTRIQVTTTEEAQSLIYGLDIIYEEPRSLDGRKVLRSDSRPVGFTTNFTSRGDSLTGIGDGVDLRWDFSNIEDEVTDSITTVIPTNYKRKRIELGFSDNIYIKEGTFYFFNVPKGCFIDMWIVCKNGAYYKDLNGTIPASALGLSGNSMYTQATADTPVTRYVNSHLLQGSAPMGDELNTEGASESYLPTQQSGYKIWVEITTPNTDIISNGSFEIELYRKRTLLLPGESL